MLHYRTVDAKTLELLIKILQNPLFGKLRLVGGTGLALQYGHRKSIDIDLFGEANFEDVEISDNLSKIGALRKISVSKYIKIYSLDGTKVDIVNYPYPWLYASIDEEGLRLADERDIAAMKLSAITNRGSKKDFIDLYFLLQRFSLEEMVNFYEKKYHDGSVFLLMKSIMYFDDAEGDRMPEMYDDVTWEAVKSKIVRVVENYVKAH